ncbi:hypothetical protein EXS66_00105 [Candidatus Saccharibacteria bacterium]|nr:hypothetical protein [Candidatus Saccharibacteria bacterium]
MKATLFYSRGDTKKFRLELSELKKNLKLNHVRLSAVDINSASAISTLGAYDILSFPALLLVRDDDTFQAVWQGTLPTSNELHQAIGYI